MANLKNEPYLCESCKPYGYCRLAVQRIKDEETLSDSKIANWVPIRTAIKDHTTSFGKKLQQAHDLFHQQEFEQASYLYLDMLSSRSDCDEIKIGLATCFYFLEKYDEAANTAILLEKGYSSEFPIKFANACEIKLKEKKEIIEQEITEEMNTKTVLETTNKLFITPTL